MIAQLVALTAMTLLVVFLFSRLKKNWWRTGREQRGSMLGSLVMLTLFLMVFWVWTLRAIAALIA